jgi:hypothetical protein
MWDRSGSTRSIRRRSRRPALEQRSQRPSRGDVSTCAGWAWIPTVPIGTYSSDLERRAVGKEIATRSGRQFLDPPPAHFRGQVDHGLKDSRYVAISDGVRFVLLPASPQSRALHGQSVEIARDAQGRLAVRPDRDRNRDRGGDRGLGR